MAHASPLPAAFDRCNRATWPEVLRRAHMAAIWGITPKQLDVKRQRGETPDPLPSGFEWSKSDVCEWLDNPRSRRGARVRRIA